MGICDTSSAEKPGRFYNSPSIYHQQLQQIPPDSAYKFDFSNNLKNNFNNKSYYLKYTFSDFKIKYCVSHKPDKNSLYITEIKIGSKLFPLVINSGQSPNIANLQDNGYTIQRPFNYEELQNTYFVIDIYEIIESQLLSLNISMKTIPQEMKSKAAYHSFFRIDLASFLFKSSKCDFPLMGDQQLSTTARISFNCFIEQLEEIQIDAGPLRNPNIQRLVFEYKDQVIVSQTRQATNNLFSLKTPPLSITDVQNCNIFLETIENENYEYISLNELKDNIIRNLCIKVSSNTDLNVIQMHTPIDMNSTFDTSMQNTTFDLSYQNPNYNYNYANNNKMNYNNQSQNLILENYGSERNQDAVLCLSNLPIFSQLNNLYFTEYGNIYNTAILNILNNDQYLHDFRKSKQISSDDFRDKLNKYFDAIQKPDYNLNILNDIQILLSRSIATDKFMFVYPTYESLLSMVMLMMRLGIIIINYILTSKEEYKTQIFMKMINTLMRREELDNGVLSYCFNNYKGPDDTLIGLYNNLYMNLFQLYIFLFQNKSIDGYDDALIELFSRLYFRKKYLRKVMLTTLLEQEYNFKELNCDALLYDEINDEKVNKYLRDDIIDNMMEFCKRRDIYNNNDSQHDKFDIFRLFKRIIANLKDSNIWVYPLDFSLFYDNEWIIRAIEKEIIYHKNENINRPPLNNDFYETLMLFSNSYKAISRVNNCLIQITNAHNQYGIYTLFIYFKSLLDYHYSLTDSKLIFDYQLLEKASLILAKDADSLSLPRLFWFYYSCHHLLLSGNLKWFIIHIINKNFDRFAFHWSFTIRQVYFKLIIFVLIDRIKNKEGQFFVKEKINPFINRTLNVNSNPYIYQADKDFDLIRKEFNVWVDRRSKDPKADFPVFNLPLPVIINGVMD